jgi:galactokinase
LSGVDQTVKSLRDVSLELLDSSRQELGDVLFRRTRHIISENQRVLDAVDALRSDDLEHLGRLVSQSHTSLRDDFEISCASVDQLVEIADACPGALGSRQIGGGFGGCVLCLTTDECLDDVREKIAGEYGLISGADPWVHVVRPTDPAGPVVTQ